MPEHADGHFLGERVRQVCERRAVRIDGEGRPDRRRIERTGHRNLFLEDGGRRIRRVTVLHVRKQVECGRIELAAGVELAVLLGIAHARLRRHCRTPRVLFVRHLVLDVVERADGDPLHRLAFRRRWREAGWRTEQCDHRRQDWLVAEELARLFLGLFRSETLLRRRQRVAGEIDGPRPNPVLPSVAQAWQRADSRFEPGLEVQARRNLGFRRRRRFVDLVVRRDRAAWRWRCQAPAGPGDQRLMEKQKIGVAGLV